MCLARKKGERLRVLEEEEEGDERRSFSALSLLLDPSSVCFRTKVRLSPALASIILPRGGEGGDRDTDRSRPEEEEGDPKGRRGQKFADRIRANPSVLKRL